ncbi:MAG: hypothetical protein MUE78_01710 [Ilumatobacteraceae bacterium]|nr:hypothetical protein [Ilumatobacteraceae bacterium]
MTELLSIVLVIAAAYGAYRLARLIEPHWVSKDGTRFVCRGQLIEQRGGAPGRDHEYRVIVQDDGTLLAGRRSGIRIDPTPWRLVGRAPDAARRRAIFLLDGGDDAGRMLALRLPTSSRAVAVLDALVSR